MKIMVIASKGGHWVQLLRLTPVFLDQEITYVSTNPQLSQTVNGSKFYSVQDGNRKSLHNLIFSLYSIFKIVYNVKPEVIMTTGSAPGLMGIIAGRFLGAKTIWIDSIANVDNVSASGKIAVLIADRVYTQWEHLSNSKIIFKGTVLS